MNRNKFYVTTPIYYVNAKPHLGTLYTNVLADVSSRWNKLLGKKVFFLTGTDEHGQKLQEAAQKENLTPKEFVDKNIPAFKKMWELYNIKYNKFIRTTDSDHEKFVIDFVKKLKDNNDIYKSTYTGLYCVPCETFVINSEKNLCPNCSRPLKEISEESYFFRLSAYEDRLLEFYEKNPDFIAPKERLNEVISFVKSGLKDICISRKNVKWGIPFPGDPDQTIYVWLDALPNYLSGIQDNLNFWWPADLHIMGKDIIKFHAIYWLAFLMSAGLELPKKLMVHGYILMGENKMSKSLGNIVDPEELAIKYGVDQVRYYLIKQMAISQDGQFGIQDLQTKIAGELANNLGNLLNRTVTLALNNNLEKVINTAKTSEGLEESTVLLKEKSEEAFRLFWDNMNHYQYHIALSELWNFIAHVNSYFHSKEPWVLAKNNKELFQEVIYATCQSLYSISIMLWPIMPNKMEELLDCLGHKLNLENLDTNNNYEQELRKNTWNKIFILKKKDTPLFIRPDIDVKETLNNKDLIKSQENFQESFIDIKDFAKVDLLVGQIIECEKILGSDKLFKLKVDLGKLGQRQVLSGVAQYFNSEDLLNKQGIFVTNLAPRKMMGLESQGMMLFAKDEKGNMKFVTLSGLVENGTRLS